MISNLEVAQERHAGITFLTTKDKTAIDIFVTILKKLPTLKKQSGGQLIIVETSV